MRTPKEVYETIRTFAECVETIRIVGEEGSRVNPNIPPDPYQDYDITFFCNDPDALLQSADTWLSTFGTILMLQTPEDMELFLPEEKGFSYLLYFDDGVKMDLTVRHRKDLADYLTEDRLTRIFLDKDGHAPDVAPSDEDYLITPPTARSFDDCCNEFWFVVPYVAKGLYRNELLFAIDHMQILRKELRRMIGWQVGTDRGYSVRLGKNDKFLQKYVSQETWQRLMETYDTGSYHDTWLGFFRVQSLFAEISKDVAAFYSYDYPTYEKNIGRYLVTLLEIHKAGQADAP